MIKVSNSVEKLKQEQALTRVAKQLKIEQIAWQTNYYQKSCQKITASSLVLGFWHMLQQGKNTLRNWSIQAGNHEGTAITKQSLNERLTHRTVKMAKTILQRALDKKINRGRLQQLQAELGDVLKHFNCVLIQDSTTVTLPPNLCEQFPGSYSHTDPTAIARFQSIYNLSEERWQDLRLGAYTDNDQSQALLPLDRMESNDLLLRDLGYYSLGSIDQITEGQYLITKWDNQTYLYHPDGEKIDLLVNLEQNEQLDLSVLAGSRHRIPMRLVARKLPKHKADQRIEEAKKDRHSKAKHSEEYYQLLKYEIYLTNISGELLNGKQIAKLYELRWYIEILFKSWKSYFNFTKVLDRKKKMKHHRVLVTIYLFLIQMVYLEKDIYHYIRDRINQQTNQFLSILKFMDVANSLLHLILPIKSLEELDRLIPQFVTHAAYEKRKDRTNLKEKFLYFKELSIKEKQT